MCRDPDIFRAGLEIALPGAAAGRLLPPGLAEQVLARPPRARAAVGRPRGCWRSWADRSGLRAAASARVVLARARHGRAAAGEHHGPRPRPAGADRVRDPRRVDVRGSRLDRRSAAVRDHGVDQAVAAAVRDVLLGVAEREQVVRVVRRQVGFAYSRRCAGASGRARPRRRPRARRARPAPRRSRAKRVCSTSMKYGWVPSERSGQVEHLRAERGGEALVRRHGRLGVVEAVEELAHRLQRPRVVAGRLRVADADAEQEAVREVARELGVLARDVGRVVLPDVEDAGDDRERAAASTYGARLLDRRAAAEPQRAVAERLDLRLRRRGPFVSAVPDADSSEFHSEIVAAGRSALSAGARSARNQPATPAAISERHQRHVVPGLGDDDRVHERREREREQDRAEQRVAAADQRPPAGRAPQARTSKTCQIRIGVEM